MRNQLRSIGTVDEPRIEIHLEPSLPLKDGMSPAKLLRVARLAFDGRRSRARAFGQDLFTDHAWDVLLSAYICEAEGSFITIARAHAWAGISLTTASRWIRALASQGLLEYKNGGNSAARHHTVPPGSRRAPQIRNLPVRPVRKRCQWSGNSAKLEMTRSQGCKSQALQISGVANF